MNSHLRVDLDTCQGHGLCYFHSDKLFALRDSDGLAEVLLDPVPEDELDAARASIPVCPERAITLVED